ncbi:hypothetical protein [Bacillus sp. E214]|uniref:hypothetical protein n=1 Tax=Bacillus sp. E214 TaxID=2587156 RepID=UPI0011E036BC|nr:hypothetical protein [Bacillus sp. E214]
MEQLSNITITFIDQMEVLLNMVEKDVPASPIKDENLSITEVLNMIATYKKLLAQEELNDQEIRLKIKIEDIFEEKKSPTLEHFINNISVEIEDKRFLIKTSSPIVRKILEKHEKTHVYRNKENDLYTKSIIISLATSFELLVAELIKDFALSNKNPNFFNDDKIDFKTLTQIGSIDTAKEYLIDKYIESILRGSVTDWLLELSKINNKINITELSKHQPLLVEMFQRRHLLIHNNGIVNNLYLSKVDHNLTKEMVNGQELDTSKEYIKDRIKVVQEIGLLLIYKYFIAIYKNNSTDIYTEFSHHITARIKTNCQATKKIYEIAMRDKTLNDQSRLYAKINYWLSKKMNLEFDDIIDDIKSFDVSTLKVEFQMAKYLLLDDLDNGFKKLTEFAQSIGDELLFNLLEWPILSLLKDYEPYRQFKSEKIDEIFLSPETN